MIMYIFMCCTKHISVYFCTVHVVTDFILYTFRGIYQTCTHKFAQVLELLSCTLN